MRAIIYSLLIAALFTGSFLAIHQTLPSILLQGVANLTALHLIALLIVHFTQKHRRKKISFYQTVFTIIILLPVFVTMTELLFDAPRQAIVARFLYGTPISYLVLFITVLCSIRMYKFMDSTN